MSSWRARAALFAVVLLAFALRVFNLDAQSIWGDEAFSVYTAKQPIAFVIGGGADTHPPLFHFLLHTWMLAAGITPFALRYLSVLWGMLTVAGGYKWCQLLVARGEGRVASAATLSALLLALSPFLIYYAQETRMYAQVAALCTLSLLFLVRWQMNGKGLSAWFSVTLLALYSHYFAFFVLAAEDFYVLWRWWQERRRTDDGRGTTADGGRQTAVVMTPQLFRIIGAQLLMALLYMPWVIAQYGYLSHQANARVGTLSLQGVWDVISKSLGALYIGTTIEGAWQIVAALACLSLALIGLVANGRGVRQNAPTHISQSTLAPVYSSTPLLALAILIPIAGAIAVNPLLPFFRERFLLIASPAFIILMTLGITSIARVQRPYFPLFPLISFICLISVSMFALANYWYNPGFHKGEYNLAIAEIKAGAQPKDAVLIYAPMQDALYDYYRIPDLDTFTLPKANLDAIRATHPRAWLLLYGDPATYDPTHSAEQYLSEYGFKAFYQSYRDGALARYDFTSEGVQVQNSRIQLGDAITLSGYALPGAVTRGSTLGISLQWQSNAPLVENYTVFVHLLGPDGKVVAQMDTQPVGGTRPTRSWQAGETIRDNIGVAIAATLPAGRYRIEVGMYQLQTLQRLPIASADGLPTNGDAVILGVVEIR